MLKNMVTQKPNVAGFKLTGCIGKSLSGFASVYSGRRADGDADVAVRICPLDHHNVSLSALEREISFLRAMEHPNILPCLQAVVDGDSLLVVTPLQDFGSVADLIHARFLFGLPEAAICHIVHDLLKAVQYIHNRDLIHRGVRCSHILISADGEAKLSGFRNSISIVRQGKRQSKVYEFSPDLKTSLLWLAPEVLQQNMEGYGSKSDIYSVGITVCEMANGFPPFSDMEHMQMLMEKLRGTTPRLLDATTLPPGADDNQVGMEQRQRHFSAQFHLFADAALKPKPDIRPSSQELLHHGFFKHMKKSKHSLTEILAPLKPMTLAKLTDQNLQSTGGVESPKSNEAETRWDFRT